MRVIETEHEPLELLDAVKALEARLGREAGGVRHGPRAIDVDVLLLGDIELSHERITLPHEQLRTRRFVLIPALELDMGLRLQEGRRWRTRSPRSTSPRACAGQGHPWPAQRPSPRV